LFSIIKRIFSVLVLGGVTGIFAALAATGFVALLTLIDRIISSIATENLLQRFSLTLCLLVVGGLLVGLLRHCYKSEPIQTVASVVGAAQGLQGLTPLNGLRSSLAALISLGSGASVGQYAPLVQLGALVGYSLNKLTGDVRERGSIALACGAAAAISTVFTAPIAGILFAHEVLLRHYSLRAFAPITVASTIGYVLSIYGLEHDAIFAQNQQVYVFVPEYFLFILIGVLGGLLAVVLMRAAHFGQLLADKTGLPEWLRPAAAGLVVAIIAMPIPEVLGTGLPVLKLALTDAYSGLQLIAIMLAKIAATAICIGFGFVGGLLSPALLIGVIFGTLASDLIGLLPMASHTDVIIYAACGMVAVVGPVIGAPLTAILLIMELTHNYEITTAAMICVAFSNLVSYRIYGRSFFDQQLALLGHKLPDRVP
jgi:CIC family chloride channel protein